MSKRGLKCKPAKRKVRKWVRIMEEALRQKRMCPGVASKMAGRLSWAASKLFKRLGRAMLRPLYDQKSRRDGWMSPELQRALEWWIKVLRSKLCERRVWEVERQQPVHLFCDASGNPAHMGAVLVADGKSYYTHHQPPQYLLDQFRRRRDKQIMALELLSIRLGLCTFQGVLEGRNVIVHSDSRGSEVCHSVQSCRKCEPCAILARHVSDEAALGVWITRN